MMRHFFVPGPVAAGSLRVRAPSSIAGLVARAGRPLASLTGERPAVTGAVNLATVTAATDQRLGTAFRAKEQARRSDESGMDFRRVWRDIAPACVPGTV